jgi:hypothetical protein
MMAAGCGGTGVDDSLGGGAGGKSDVIAPGISCTITGDNGANPQTVTMPITSESQKITLKDHYGDTPYDFQVEYLPKTRAATITLTDQEVTVHGGLQTVTVLAASGHLAVDQPMTGTAYDYYGGQDTTIVNCRATGLAAKIKVPATPTHFVCTKSGHTKTFPIGNGSYEVQHDSTFGANLYSYDRSAQLFSYLEDWDSDGTSIPGATGVATKSAPFVVDGTSCYVE